MNFNGLITFITMAFFALVSLGCQSTQPKYIESSVSTEVHEEGPDWITDNFNIDRGMPSRPREYDPLEFYSQECAQTLNASHYSKTSYDCDFPLK